MANNEGAGLAVGLVVGALIGAAIALILTPQLGEKTRELLKTKAGEWSAKARDTYREALKDAKDDAPNDLEL
jgi:gas vesicle protein